MVAALILAVSATVGPLLLGVAPAHGALSPGAILPVTGLDSVSALACPTDTLCVAIGSGPNGYDAVPVTLGSSGALAAGTPVSVPVEASVFGCSATRCLIMNQGGANNTPALAAGIAIGADGILTVGQPVESTLPDGYGAQAEGVDCTPRACFVTGLRGSVNGLAGFVRAYGIDASGNASAGQSEIVPGMAVGYDIDCAGSTSCLVAGIEDIYVETSVIARASIGNDGLAVTSAVPIPGAAGARSLDCLSPTSCLVASRSPDANGNGHVTPVAMSPTITIGTPVVVTSGTDPDALCSRDLCNLANGGAGITPVLVEGSTATPLDTYQVGAGFQTSERSDSNACTPTSGRCFLGTTGGLVPLATLPRPDAPIAVAGLDGVLAFGCLTDTRCVAIGQGSSAYAAVPLTVGAGGGLTAGAPVPINLADVGSLALGCNATECVATTLSIEGTSYRTQVSSLVFSGDGGLLVSDPAIDPATNSFPYGVDCAPTRCLVVGLRGADGTSTGFAEIVTVSDTGAVTLGQTERISGMAVAFDVDCVGTSLNCLVAGIKDLVGTTDSVVRATSAPDGLVISAAVDVPDGQNEPSIDCSDTSSCLIAWRDGGNTTPGYAQPLSIASGIVLGSRVSLGAVTRPDVACTADFCHVLDPSAGTQLALTDGSTAKILTRSPLAGVRGGRTSGASDCTPTSGRCYVVASGGLVPLQATYADGGTDPVNRAPIVATALADQNASEDSAFSYQVPAGAFADPDGDNLTYAASLDSGAALPSWLSFDATTRTFSGTPAQANVGSLSIKVTASDPGGLSVSDTFALTIAAVNDPPVVATPLLDQSASEDTAFSYQVPAGAFTDPDNATLTYSATLASGAALPAWLTFTPGTRTFSGTPAQSDVGALSIKVTATDAGNLSASDTVALVVSAVNDAPVVASAIPDQHTDEDSAYSYTVPAGTFTDVDDATLTYSATGAGGAALPSWLSFDAGTRTFSGTPRQGDVGSVQLTVTAKDPSLAKAADTFTLTVDNVNDAPTATVGLAPATVRTNDTLTATATKADADGDAVTLTYRWTVTRGGQTCLVRTTTTAALTDTLDLATSYPATGCSSSSINPAKGDVVTVRVTPNDGTVDGDPVSDNRTVLNSAPTLLLTGSVVQSVQYSDSISALTATASDPDGDTLTFSSTGLPAGVALSGTGNSRTVSGHVTAVPGVFAGSVAVSDGAASNSDAFTITVTPENASVGYTGDHLKPVGSSLTLEATVLDSAAAGYAGAGAEPGGAIGDVTRMAVVFDLYAASDCAGTVLFSTAPAAVTDGAVAGDGIGEATTTLTAQSEQAFCAVARIVSTSYTAAASAPEGLAFYSDTGQFVAGGGDLADGSSFSVSSRYNKSGKPQGQVAYSYKSSRNGVPVRVVVRTNVLTGIAFSGRTYPVTATLEGKATVAVYRVSDGVLVESFGGAPYLATLTDGDKVSPDKFALTVWSDSKRRQTFKTVPSSTVVLGNVVIRNPK